jgi:hypothetical protein
MPRQSRLHGLCIFHREGEEIDAIVFPVKTRGTGTESTVADTAGGQPCRDANGPPTPTRMICMRPWGTTSPTRLRGGRRQEPQTSLPRCLIDGEHDSAVPSLNTLEDTRHPYVDFLRSFWLVSRRCL